MIPEVHGRALVASEDQPAARFGISMPDTAHLMTILRDTLYSDKVRAVLREYGANAKDSHYDPRMPPERRLVPIEVTLPSHMAPTLEIRDHGPGLTHDEVFRIFTQYGASTKRGSNDAIGYLGIGSKSGFAYGDSFTIISRCEGRRRTYVAVLDASEEGEIRLLDDSAENTDDTGVTIQIAVRTRDVYEFVEKARETYRYYNPRPVINTEMPEHITTSTVDPQSKEWVAVMGGVAYPIDMDQIEVHGCIKRSGGVAFFDIGALRVSASREALKYDEHTKANLVATLTQVLDSYVERFTRQIKDFSPWQKRLHLQGMGLFGKLVGHVAFPGAFDETVSLTKEQQAGLKVKVCFEKLRVDHESRLVFVDDARSIKGYGLKATDHIVRRKDCTYAEAWDAIPELLALLRIDGIPVVRTSELPWTRPTASIRAARSKARAFVFKGQTSHCRWPLSNNWGPETERAPTEDDIYVVLDAFHTPMYDMYQQDRQILRTFDIDPVIYGYKRDKSGNDTHPGTTYQEWRKGLYEMVAAKYPQVDELMAALAYERYFYNITRGDKEPAQVIKKLGENHPVSQIIARMLAAKTLIEKAGEVWVAAVRKLARQMGKNPSDTKLPEVDAVYKAYPLVNGQFQVFFQSDAKNWVDYVAAMDFHRKEASNGA